MAELAVGGVAWAGYAYNRGNWMFDKKLAQRREYQFQGMYVKLWELYREDIRDLVELTCSKMDNYLLINTLLIGFCIHTLTEGRPEPSGDLSRWWLHWLYAVSAAGGLMYFMISVWLAMHASVSAHSFGVRMLTQSVRLPVPSEAQIDAVRYKAGMYEERTEDWLRVPLVQQQMKRMEESVSQWSPGAAEARSSTAEQDVQGLPATGPVQPDTAQGRDAQARARAEETLALEHVEHFRHVQAANWQAYDAYARVCTAMGASQLLLALSYYSIICFVCENYTVWPALCCALVFAGSGWLILRLDVYLKGKTLVYIGLIYGTAPVLAVALVTTGLSQPPMKSSTEKMVPVLFLFHIIFVWLTLKIASPEGRGNVALPTAFRAVLYLDVYNVLTRSDVLPTPQNAGADGETSMLPEAERVKLQEYCDNTKAEVDRELRLWETEAAEEQLQSSQPMLDRVARCRQRLKQLEHKVPELAKRLPLDADELIWLRLYLTSVTTEQAHDSVEFYYTAHSGGQITGSLPGPDSRVSDLWEIEEKIGELVVKSAQLKGVTPHLLLSGFGETGQDLDPRAPSGDQSLPAEGKLGQLPWWTFQQGTHAVLFLWFVGFVASVLELNLHIALPLKPVQPEALGMLDTWAGPELLLSGGAPHMHFNPRGLSCNSAWGPALLVHEKYAVHMLRLDDAREEMDFWSLDPGSTFDVALSDCMEQMGEFQAEGILSIAIDCKPQTRSGGSHCHALLLGTGGKHLARCTLEDGARGPDARQSELGWIQVHGGPWRSLAAHASGWWALSGPMLAQLQPRDGYDGQLLPQVEMSAVAVNTSQLHALPGGRAVLGLEERGRLTAWFTEDVRRLAWSLPSETRWAGVCATTTALYFVGVSRRTGDLGIWRSALPPELAVLTLPHLPGSVYK